MKILFYNHTGQVSGAERVLLSMLAGVSKSPQHHITVCCPAASSLAQAVAELHVNCAPIAELRARFTWRPDHLLRYLWSFAQVIRDFRARIIAAPPDLIHANSVRAGLVATAATIKLGKLRVPVIWHIHDVLPRHPLSLLIRSCALLSSRTHLLAVSRAVAKRFQSALFSHAPAQVIHNGVDVARFLPDAAARASVREELALSESDFVIGTIGQIAQRKGQLELIRAFAALTEPRARLLIVGAPLFAHDHVYAARLHSEVARLGLAERVRFLGARRDVPAVLQALDLAVIPSHSDPFPLVMLEAMASGTAVLATAVDGIPELIEHLETGWLVPPRNVAALTAGIAALRQAPEMRARLAAQGCERVRAQFTSAHFQQAAESYLLDVCAQHSSPANNQSGAALPGACRATITSEQ